MRLGLKKINLVPSNTKSIYHKDVILERHRHRFAINDSFKTILQQNDCFVSGSSEEGIIEIIELKDHPWYIGCQFHPEYNSTPFNPHRLFISFIHTCIYNGTYITKNGRSIRCRIYWVYNCCL